MAVIWVDLYRGENRLTADAVSQSIVDKGWKHLSHQEAYVQVEQLFQEWLLPEQAAQIAGAAGALALELTAVLAP